MKLRIAWLSLLFLALAVIPASAQVIIYDNGPANGSVDAWTINFGYTVSDSFTVGGSPVVGFDFTVWAYPGDTALTVDWSITSNAFVGTTYGSGTASLSSTFISSNQYGYDIDSLSASGLNVRLGAGTYWLNLQNATTSFGDPLFWDENSGPSSASESPFRSSALGTIASEAFDVLGTYCSGCGCYADGGTCKADSTPEPSSILLFGSGIVALAGVLRRKLF
jgi:hypothetical protein